MQTSWADARAAERTFEANDQALEAASLAMTNAEARFEAGAISALEYADARTRLDNASINALRTQYDFVFKTRILDFYMGRPLESLNHERNKKLFSSAAWSFWPWWPWHCCAVEAANLPRSARRRSFPPETLSSA